jgi:vacuolar-type H+-ATPase subunit H
MAENVLSRIRRAEEEAALTVSAARESAVDIIRRASTDAEALLAENGGRERLEQHL